MRAPTLVVMVLVAAGCESRPRHDPLVICHNANCAYGPDAFYDDTEQALRSVVAAGQQRAADIRGRLTTF